MVMTLNTPIVPKAGSAVGVSLPPDATRQEGTLIDNLIAGPATVSVQTIIFLDRTPIPGSFELSRSVLAEIEATSDGIVIRSGEVDEEGYGFTYEDAYNDFVTSLCDRYQSLSRREERLSPQDHSVLETLRTLLKPVQG